MRFERVVWVGAACSALAGTQMAGAQNAGAVTEGAVPAQTTAATGQQASRAAGVRVHGAVTDPDGALIPGATVTLTPAKGGTAAAAIGKSSADGLYTVTVPSGTYSLTVTMPGFSSFVVPSLKVGAVAAMTLDVKMQLGTEDVVVNVDANQVQLSVDPDSNADATVLQGKDLEALSDDPDELESQLEALAGPAAGPNGGQIYVDGFTGGSLPPKSQIREIRINQNPFSAQYDKLGFGRIEVFTKPGTDKLHGSFQFNYDPSQFNTANPLSTAPQPSYHTLFMFGSITGPMTKSSSFNLSGSHRDIQTNAFTDAIIPTATAGLTEPCAPGLGAACAANTTLQEFTTTPQYFTEISPRLDFALGEKNVLTVRYQFIENDQLNQGLGNIDLPENGYNIFIQNHDLQISDTQTYSSKLINETRFDWRRAWTRDVAFSSAPQVTVSGSFTAGGATVGGTTDHQNHFEFQNYTSYALKKHFIRIGGRLRSDADAQNPQTNTNGVFTYASLVNYEANAPTQFTLSVLNQPTVRATLTDLGVYAEDDWKIRPNLTFSYGLRYETQNHISDHHDFAPRLSFAYGVPGKHGAPPQWVLRGGMGYFYDRFALTNVLNLEEYSPTNPIATQYTVTSFANAACSPSNISACISGAEASAQAVYTRTANLRAPYTIQFAFGADRAVGKIGTMTVNYIHSLGLHQLVQQNVDYPTNGTIPGVGAAINDQYFSIGAFHQDQLNLGARFKTTKWLSLSGYYSLGFAVGDASGAGSDLSVPYNIQADRGRTLFDVRSHANVTGSISLPHYIQLSPFLLAQSGTPYNIVIGQDINHDGYLNDRAYTVASGTTAATGSTVKTIAGCGTFTNTTGYANESLAPINACTGPSEFSFNLRATKTWGFGGSRDGDNRRNRGDGGSGSQGFGPVNGPQGGGGPRGGGPRGGGNGGTNTGQRYNLAVGVQLQNLFNNKDLATPNGTLLSSFFGQSTQLVGAPYTTTGAVQRIQVQASFTF